MSVEERLTRPDDAPWRTMAPGIDIKLLFSSKETGRWTVIIRGQKGASFGRHKHYAAGEYYVIKGCMDYRMGSAVQGTYGYEPLGVIHEKTTFSEDTELLFTNYGPVIFLDEEGNMESILDNEFLESLPFS